MHTPARIALVLALLLGAGCGPASLSAAFPSEPRLDLVYLRPAPCDRLYVEVDSTVGSEPIGKAVAALERFLREHCEKPGGLEVVVDPAIPGTSRGFERVALRHMRGPPEAAPGTAYLYVLLHDEGGDPFEKALAWVDLGDPAAIFVNMGKLRAAAEFIPRARASDILPRILVHEAAHALGLVRNRARGYGDGAHCEDGDCLMAPTPEIPFVGSLLGLEDWGVPPLCAPCAADLATSRRDVSPPLSFHGPAIVLRDHPAYKLLALPRARLIGTPEQVRRAEGRELARWVRREGGRSLDDRSMSGFLADLETDSGRQAARRALDAARTDPLAGRCVELLEAALDRASTEPAE